MDRKLRYSERKRLAEEGALGDLVHDDVPSTLRVALRVTLTRAPIGGRASFLDGLTLNLVEHFGTAGKWESFVDRLDVDGFLDLLEIACEGSHEKYRLSNYPPMIAPFYPGLEEKLNELMERHRFGYRIENGDVRKLGSPALDVEVVGPGLLAVQRPGWEEVGHEFRKALDHQRGGEIDDALTAANAAVEAALKAIGMKGTTLGSLAKSFTGSQIAPSYLANVPELLEDLLGKLMAARSTHGDAHGKAPGTKPAEQALADLAVYWAGAFIAYLAEIAP